MDAVVPVWLTSTAPLWPLRSPHQCGSDLRKGLMASTPEEIERRLDAGEWLRPGDVAILLGVSRKTVDRMLPDQSPTMRWRRKPGTGRHREVHPEDVRRELDARRNIVGED